MAGVASAAEIDEFINGALVSWLESCLPRPEILTGYSSLLDGKLIHSVWLKIDPEPQNNPQPIANLSGTALNMARAKNFECIVRNLKALYEEEFGQTIVLLPDTYTLGHQPDSKHGLEQMKVLLTLLLGAAVQCPNKEQFIARIKELDVDTQHAIVELIKQVTDSHSLVLNSESIDILTPIAMYSHIMRLVKERDNMYLKIMTSSCQEPEMNLSGCGDGTANMPMSPSTAANSSGLASANSQASANSESNHMAVELADLKSKLRKLRQELEEKAESQLELREELDHKTAQYEKLRTESQDWYAEARRSAAYRDEVDVLRERAERADRLEVEVNKMREKLADSEFYKTRVEELREDNRMLLETKDMLEDQLQRSRLRSEHVMKLEAEIIKYKQIMNDMTLERDVDRSKLVELLEENTQLQLVAKNLNSTHEADKSFSDNDDDCNSGDNSLSEQLTNSAQTRAIKLELENRRLMAALDQLKESSFHESSAKVFELEKEKKKLSLKLDQLQESLQRQTQQNAELENVFKNALEENKKLQDSLDLRQAAMDRQSLEREAERHKLIDLEKLVETLTKEKQRIQTLGESTQRRADDLERMLDTRTKEVDQIRERVAELDEHKEKLYDLDGKLASAERENASLLKEVAKLKECLEQKSVQLDESVSQLEGSAKEVQRLSKSLADTDHLQERLADLEKLNHDLNSQRDIDLQTIATLRNDLVSGTLASNKVRTNLERLGLSVDQTDDSAEQIVEAVVEKLVRNPETFKTVREIMLTVSKEQRENATSDMCVLCHRQEIFTVEKNIELSSASRTSTPPSPPPPPSEAATATVPPASSASSPPVLRTVEHKVVLSGPRDAAELARLSETNTQLNSLNVALQSANEQLQAENARLLVDVATLGSQITSLNTQHVALQLANSQLAADKDALLKQIETVSGQHRNLLHDQITLQCLHDQLSSEYESLNTGKEHLRTVVRDLRNELRDQRERSNTLQAELEEAQRQNQTMKSYSEDLAILRTEHSKLTDDFRNLFATSDRFKNEYKNIQEQYKMIRMENSKLKLQNTELSGEVNIKSDQVRQLEIEYSKVTQHCEMLLQTNADLDTDRKTLMENVSQLLSQYHELLSHSLEDKQRFHEEEKTYSERMHNLSRQKEKLEEKIMEHYKKAESTVPKKKPFASGLVRRVKKASSDLMNKVPSRNRRSWVDDSRLPTSQFMIGSESGGNDSDNSNEDVLSTPSETLLIPQPPNNKRKGLQRELLDSTLSRGGAVRSSLQAHKRTDLNNSRRNSVHGLEAPDVTGSSLTLGTAGSRRTVYLIDENQKIPPDPSAANNPATTTTGAPAAGAQTIITSNVATPQTGAANTNLSNANSNNNSGLLVTAGRSSTPILGSKGGSLKTSTSSTAEPQTPTHINNINITASASSSSSPAPPGCDPTKAAPAAGENPATFLVYNRINTTIGGDRDTMSLPGGSSAMSTSALGGMQQQQQAMSSSSLTQPAQQDDKLLRKRNDDKSNSIWYEYGCV